MSDAGKGQDRGKRTKGSRNETRNVERSVDSDARLGSLEGYHIITLIFIINDEGLVSLVHNHIIATRKFNGRVNLIKEELVGGVPRLTMTSQHVPVI